MSYSPVRITTLKPEKQIPFSLYIHFKDQYLQYIKPGSEIDKIKFKKLRKQRITKFYILSQEETKYQKFLDSLLEDILNDKNISLDEKTEVVEGQAVTALDKLQENPESEESYNMTQKAASNLRRLIFSNPEAVKKLFGDNEEVIPLFNHSMNVCVLSIKFALSLKINDQDIDLLATAALMHDIGLTKLSEEDQKFFNSPKKELSAAQKIKYWEHCKNIKKTLEEKPYINNTVLKLIENHEETKTGDGPNKVKKLTQLEELLSLVNTYDKKISTEGISPKEALNNMMIDELGNYDLNLIKKFQDLLTKEGVV